MRTRVRIALTVLVLATAGVVGWQVLRARGPTYQGRTLLSWLEQHGTSSAPSEQDRAALEAAEIALRHIGTNALPTLSAWAGCRDSPFRTKTLTLLSDEARAKLRVYSANDYHAFASYGFGVFRSIAKPAVPGLIQLLGDSDPDTRAGAAFCLCRIGPAAEEAVPALLRCLGDSATRDNAFAALRSISAKPDVVVPVLIGHLGSPAMDQQAWALKCLGEFGADAKTALPAVLTLLDDHQLYVRQTATNALRKIDPAAAAGVGVK
jgi:hypothetical protein